MLKLLDKGRTVFDIAVLRDVRASKECFTALLKGEIAQFSPEEAWAGTMEGRLMMWFDTVPARTRRMREHHARALEQAKTRLVMTIPDLLAIILGGSVAKGIERDDSDVDLMVVIPDSDYQSRLAENRVSFLWKDVCDYEHGYVEGRFLSRSFITEAAMRGSEPTRHAFTGTYPIYCVDPTLADELVNIPIYPMQQQQERITAFYAQMHLYSRFFWAESRRRGDRYLHVRSAAEIVLFGCRL